MSGKLNLSACLARFLSFALALSRSLDLSLALSFSLAASVSHLLSIHETGDAGAELALLGGGAAHHPDGTPPTPL